MTGGRGRREFWVLRCCVLADFGTQSQNRLEFWILASSLAILKTQNPKRKTQNRSSSLRASQIS
jgi:hypothetical protein